MKKLFVLSVLSALCLATVARAGSKSALTGNDPAKIAVLVMNVYNVVGSGDGLGAAAALSKEAEAGKEVKSESAGFDFKAVAKYGLEQYKTSLSGVRKWQVVSAKELGKDAAIAKFAQTLKDNEAKIPGSLSANWSARWTSADDLPIIQTMWVEAIGAGDYKKVVLDAAKQFCADAGVDGVWLQSNYLGYGTKGASKFLSKMTMGSGSATAIVNVSYVLVDKEGQIVVGTGKTADNYRSEQSFMMAGGVKAVDQEMMKYQEDALSVSAREVAKKVGK